MMSRSVLFTRFYCITHLVGEGDHGEDEAGEGGEEDSSEWAQRDALRVVQDGALVPLAARPVTPWKVPWLAQ